MTELVGLNEAQKKAVLHTDGPLMIIAGAGTGKTRVITERIVHLIETGVLPEQILAITFTNKAAAEMRDRVRARLKNHIDRPPFMGTFHALGVQILRENARAAGLQKYFSIFDRDDSIRLMKEAVKDAGLDPKVTPPSMLLSLISKEKGEGVTMTRFREERVHDYFTETLVGVWERYEEKLKKESALDFDDLLLRPLQLLQKNEDIRKAYATRWNYVHIDEYQDTNKVQYELSRILAESHHNICVVGDMDQSIYGWRGARLRNMFDFERDFPERELVMLEENYRSTQTILAAANQIIQKNEVRKEKNLFTKNDAGKPISVTTSANEDDEAVSVADTAGQLIREGVEPSEIAVLFRANFQSRALEEAFLSSNVPYQVVGTRFFERKEVRNTLSFIEAALNPESSTHLSRIINVPPRGIGKSTLLKMLTHQDGDLSPALHARVTSFYELLKKIKDVAENDKPSAVIKYVLTATKMDVMLREDGEEGEERIQNVKELATLASRFDDTTGIDGTLRFLEDAALMSDQDNLEKKTASVKLMTVHAAKGLEFKHVFITGLEEGLFPFTRDDAETREDKEEERRLFYVALTRAKERAYLSHASVRTIFGSARVSVPSQFFFDIDESLLDNPDTPTITYEKSSDRTSGKPFDKTQGKQHKRTELLYFD